MDGMTLANPKRTTRIALAFEGSLGLAAILIGWLLGFSPFVGVGGEGGTAPAPVAAVGWGLVATGPLIAALLLIERVPLEPLRQLCEMAREIIRSMFAGASALQLVAVAIAAGIGEELLFRGLVQAYLSRLIGGWLGVAIALVVASVLFGICHWLNTTYAVLAMLAGAYFGLLLAASGSIWTPVVAHAAYDFVALVYLVRPQRLVGSSI
jgi:membrane protease YdiL (CAAX protease family)